MPDQGFPDKVWLGSLPNGDIASGWLLPDEKSRFSQAVPYVPESHAIDLETELSLERERREQVEQWLEEAEDRFQACDNCERPTLEDDLETIWCRDQESGEQIDARICPVCRTEAALRELAEATETALDLAERAHGGEPRTGEDYYSHRDFVRVRLSKARSSLETKEDK